MEFISGILPYKSTARIAFVFFVIFFSMSTGSIHQDSGSISANTTFTPIQYKGSTLAIQEILGATTSSPFFNPKDK